MGRLGKCFRKGIHFACSEEQGDSDGDPFVPNDFAEDDSFQVSEDGEMDNPECEKAYMISMCPTFLQAGERR